MSADTYRCPLLDLPLEIRLLIYHYVLPASSYTIGTCRDIDCLLCREDDSEQFSGLRIVTDVSGSRLAILHEGYSELLMGFDEARLTTDNAEAMRSIDGRSLLSFLFLSLSCRQVARELREYLSGRRYISDLYVAFPFGVSALRESYKHLLRMTCRLHLVGWFQYRNEDEAFYPEHNISIARSKGLDSELQKALNHLHWLMYDIFGKHTAYPRVTQLHARIGRLGQNVGSMSKSYGPWPLLRFHGHCTDIDEDRWDCLESSCGIDFIIKRGGVVPIAEVNARGNLEAARQPAKVHKSRRAEQSENDLVTLQDWLLDPTKSRRADGSSRWPLQQMHSRRYDENTDRYETMRFDHDVQLYNE